MDYGVPAYDMPVQPLINDNFDNLVLNVHKFFKIIVKIMILMYLISSNVVYNSMKRVSSFHMDYVVNS